MRREGGFEGGFCHSRHTQILTLSCMRLYLKLRYRWGQGGAAKVVPHDSGSLGCGRCWGNLPLAIEASQRATAIQPLSQSVAGRFHSPSHRLVGAGSRARSVVGQFEFLTGARLRKGINSRRPSLS